MQLILDTDLMDTQKIDVQTYLLLQVIHSQSVISPTGWCMIPDSRIAKWMGCVPNTVLKEKEELLEAGLIEIHTSGPSRTTNKYKTLLQHPSQKNAEETFEEKDLFTPKKNSEEVAIVPVKTKAAITRAEPDEEIVPEGYQVWIDLWNKLFKGRMRVTPDVKKQIRARRKSFTKEEIQEAMLRRYYSKWLRSDGKKHWKNWTSFWRNDSKVQNYLQLPKTEMVGRTGETAEQKRQRKNAEATGTF